LREFYSKVKDNFLAKASLPWHPVNSNVYKQKDETCLLLLFVEE